MIKCLLCGNRNQEIVRSELRFGIKRKVLRCPSCDLVWLEPKQEDLQEFYREEYRQKYSPAVGREMSPQETFDMYRPKMDERIERVKPHLDKSARVLEIGCSTGHFLDALGPWVGERIGLEFNEAHAAFIRETLGIQVYTDPIENTDQAKQSFDLIFMFHVFEHVEDPVGFLRGVSEYLSPKGKVYIEVPNIQDALVYPYEVPGYAEFYYREPHLFYFSPETMRSVTKRAGFEGDIEMIQRYGLANHIHWSTADSPQPDAETAMGIPNLVRGNSEDVKALNEELGVWLSRIDHEYRELLIKHERADTMAFVGSRTDS